jgi:ornithine cyclodeaminase
VQLLDHDAVRARLPMPAAIAAMRTTFRALAAGEVTAPPRGFHDIAALGDGGMLATMPAHVGGSTSVLATKVVSIVPTNADRGLPTIHGLLAAFDGTTGEPLGVVDGTAVTTIRTAAVSGLATDLLAPADATTLAVLGTGVQGREHVAAVRAVRGIERVTLWNRTTARAAALADELRAEGLQVTVADTPAAAVADAAVVCACTAATEPLIHLADLAPGAHVNAVGAFTPTMRELATDLVAGAWVAVDTREGAWEEAGDLLLAEAEGAIDRAHVRADLGELLTGAVTAPPPGTTTLFKSVGHAAEDAVTAAVLLRD